MSLKKKKMIKKLPETYNKLGVVFPRSDLEEFFKGFSPKDVEDMNKKGWRTATEYNTLSPLEKMLHDRNATHGDFVENCKMAANIYNAWTGQNVQPVDVDKMQQCLKMAREASNPNFADHRDDQGGYVKLRDKFYK